MRVQRFYYQSTIEKFLLTDEDAIAGAIEEQDDFSSLRLTQKDTWREEIVFLKNILTDFKKGHIIFEYSIPRLGKRIDTVLIINGIIFVLEFKVNADRFLRQDIDQV